MSRLVLTVALVVYALGCRQTNEGAGARTPSSKVRIVFQHQPLWGDPQPFRALLDSFRRDNPDVELATEAFPNSSDVAHQYLLTALEAKTDTFDVFVADVVWIPEFARAGWVADLSVAFSPDQVRADFLPGAAEAVLYEGQTYAVPWYLDVGLLYYRKDLVPSPPHTYAQLVAEAKRVTQGRAELYGYVWQGRQYEGLVCNVYEAIWGHGGQSLADGKLAVDTPEARTALTYLRGLIQMQVSPPSTLSAAEEDARRLFQMGRAVFMRNWPYAWKEAQSADSPIRDKVGFSALPTASGELGAGTLGGWQLAVNSHVSERRRDAAMRLVKHLTSLEANVVMAIAYGRNPPRRAAYDDERIATQTPFIAALRPIIERARPRPVTPYYNMLSDVLQSEFSAAVAGLRSPEAALHRAQLLADHLSGERP